MKNQKHGDNLKLVEAITYSVLIIVVILVNAYGPIYIRMLPLLFILGIIGNVFFGRPIVTTVFGIIASMCIVHLKDKYGFFQNIFISFTLGLNIALGEVVGDFLKKTYTYLKNHKKSFLKKEIVTYIITIILLFVICPLVHGFINGNYTKYNNAKQKLNDYLKEEYDTTYQNFVIKNAYYKLQKDRNYLFYVKIQDNIYTFKVYLNDNLNVLDGYKESILEKNNNKIKSEFNKYVANLNVKNFNNILFDEKINLVSILYESENVNENFDEILEKIFVDVNNLVNFSYIQDINSVNILINSKSDDKESIDTSIDIKNYSNISSDEEKLEYLRKAFYIEYMEY